jgi:conjugative relaxase-like TrwC/TraI family protein
VLSVGFGSSVDYYTQLVGGSREAYYTGPVAEGEPAGVWYGAGAAELGLSGVVDAELMEAIYERVLDPRDPLSHDRATWGHATPLAAGHRHYRSAGEIYEDLLAKEPDAGPERRAELLTRAERRVKEARAFADVTFSAPKSVSVLAAAFERQANDARAAGDEEAAQAWSVLHQAVEDAVMEGARAAIDYLQDVAGYSRVGHHGGGAGLWADAHKFVTAQFLQHDSRNGDPQLHVHGVILNRVPCADGTWRAIDTTLITSNRGGASAIAIRVMAASITQSVGALFAAHDTRRDGVALDIVGVSQELCEWFSSRERDIGPNAEQELAEFRDRKGREPTPFERNHLLRTATLATRAPKSHDGLSHAEQLDQWATQAEEIMIGGLAQVARNALSYRGQTVGPAPWSEREVKALAVARAAQGKQTWSRSDAMRAAGDVLPADLGLAPGEVRPFLECLTDAILEEATQTKKAQSAEGAPAELRLANGQLAFVQPGIERWAAPDQIAAEGVLRAAAVERGAAAVSVEQVDVVLARFAESGIELGPDQARAVRGVLTSGAWVEVISAAAGTGKSFTVGVINEAWREVGGGRLFGLTTAQNAADVLTDEDGVPAANIAAWLAMQQRLAEGRPRPGDEQFALRAGDIVTVDESSMVSTPHLAAIQQLCRAAEVKLLLVGDGHQLAAIGPGGAMSDIAARTITYPLVEVRRFEQDWERTASLRFRDGDTSVLDEYAKHGRLIDGGTLEETEAAAARAWLADTVAGKESLLTVASNEQADRVSAALRAQLVRHGRVQEAGVMLGTAGTLAGVGDLVQARRNDRTLIGFEGNTTFPVNRKTYRVQATRDDGGLTVRRVLGRVEGVEQLDPRVLHLPAEYVTDKVRLAYASTVHAALGRTVDTGHGIIGRGMNANSGYVAITRGRERNTIWAPTRSVPTGEAPGLAHKVPARTARAVLADLLDRAEVEKSALAQKEQADLDARSVLTHGDELIASIDCALAGRTARALDWLAAEGVLDPYDRARLAADEAFRTVEALLRTAELAGHDPDTVLARAVAGRDFSDAHHPAQALRSRIGSQLKGQLTPKITGYTDLIPTTVPQRYRAWLDDRAQAAENRCRELGPEIAQHPPQWARETLGPVSDPEDVAGRAAWETKAGRVAAYRELMNYTNDADPLGYAPGARLPDKQALWHAARVGLDLPDTSPEEQGLTDGRLLLRVQTYEREQARAPRYVADELEAAHHHAQQHRTNATIWADRAAVTPDPEEAATLRTEAGKAQAQADALAQRISDLEIEDTARSVWFAATASTRDKAHRAEVELGVRGIRVGDPTEQTTAEEWMAAHLAEQAAEDPHREVHDETDFTDDDLREMTGIDHVPDALVETAVCDGSETSTTDPTPPRRGAVIDQSAASVARARSVLADIHAREQYDHTREAEEPTRWAEPDHATERADELVSEC